MRIWFLFFLLFATASPLAAQELARVETVAQVRIPDFMILEAGSVTEERLEDGRMLRRVTLLVTANRSWTFDVARLCTEECTPAEYSVSRTHGRSGNALPIVIEYSWDAGEPAPAPEEFHYLLTGP